MARPTLISSRCRPFWPLFLFLFLAPGAFVVQAQPVGAEDESSSMPWWKRAVFYEVFVRSFADAAEGPLACDGVGDLQGLIARLDYLNDGDASTTEDLGVTALWLMPVMQSPSYHGYDVLDYYTVEQDYGTNDDFKQLVDAAQERGIRVIVDLVLNHTSNAHPWFAEAADVGERYRDWYVWADSQRTYPGPWGQQVWHPRDAHWYYGIFGPHMPDVNYRNPEATEAAQEIMRYWLEDMGVDGFRLDAIRHLIEDGPVQANTDETHTWLQERYAFYKDVKPDAVTVGEVWDDTDKVVRYIRDRELDLAFEFDMAGAILEAVRSGAAAPLQAQLKKSWESFPPGQYATFITNHDQNRVMSELGGSVEKAKLAATILLTAPGVPFLYYGEEIGMTGEKPDVKIRTPMQWTPEAQAGFTACRPWQAVKAGYEAVNVQTEAADPASLLGLYRKLIHLRAASPSLRQGTYVPVAAEAPGVLAFLREAPEEAVLVVVNLGDAPVEKETFTLASGPLAGKLQAEALLQAQPVAAPRLNDAGGFDRYQPFQTLAPQTAHVIRLTAEGTR